MSCVGDTCGTGGWGGPKPGDPSNNSILSATPAFGGIDVRWTFPTVNPFAVAYTRIFRAIIPDFNAAIVIVDPAGGSFYYDPLPYDGVTYYYWIQFVSINGTYGDIIGPASAQSRDSIANTIEQLTGKIDAGVLAQALKTEIARIPEIDDKIFKEIEDRLASNVALSNALAQVTNVSNETKAFVLEEITQRVEADSAFVDSINTLFAQAAGNAAAINDEKLVRVSKDEALTSQINTLFSRAGSSDAAIQATNTAIANQATATTNQIATSRASLTTEMNGRIASAVQDEATNRTNADNTLGQRITNTESTLGTNIAQAETRLQTNINTTNGKVTSIGALYTAKVTVNGLIGGFGVYNDGTEVQAGFDVDTFWIGRTAANKRKPFIVVGSEVFIDQAVINQLTFSKLRADDGSVIVENGKLKANFIDADNIVARQVNLNSGVPGQPTSSMTNGLFQVFDGAGMRRMRLGIW